MIEPILAVVLAIGPPLWLTWRYGRALGWW